MESTENRRENDMESTGNDVKKTGVDGVKRMGVWECGGMGVGRAEWARSGDQRMTNRNPEPIGTGVRPTDG